MPESRFTMHQTQRASAKLGPIAQWTIDTFVRLITSGSGIGRSERHANRTRQASAAQPPIVKPCGEAKMHVPSCSITRRDPGPESSEGRKAPVFGQMDWLRTTNMDVCVSNGRYTGTRSMGGTRTGGRRTYWGLYGSTKRTEAAGIVRRGVL